MLSNALDHLDCQMTDLLERLAQDAAPFIELTHEQILHMHQMAFLLYKKQEFQEAVHFFRLLTLVAPTGSKFWKGFGACLKILKNEKQALDAYAKAQALNGEQKDPYLYIYMADCHFALKQKEKGMEMLEAARLRAEKKRDLRILKHVTLMRELWSN